MARLLVVDDAYHEVRAGLEAVLEEHQVVGATDGAAALRLIAAEPNLEVVLLDVRMPPKVGQREEEEGLVVFERIRELRPDLPVIFLSAYDDLRVVNRALKAGAFWYLKKPPDLEETRSLVRRAVESARRMREAGELRCAVEARSQAAATGRLPRSGRTRLLGGSPPMRQLRAELAMLAATEVPVLLLGETGTGKEVCAREVHELSARRGGPFHAINCHELNQGDVPMSRLFGHAKGAFTGAQEATPGAFELAAAGTLFLDEIADLQPEIQGRLLRVLQEREVVRLGAGEKPRPVDVRLVFATNRDPHAMVRDGALREDFYYRIAIGVVQLPPLRDHLDDLDELVPALLRRAAEQDRVPSCEVGPSAIERLRCHAWPGNVRELDNVLKRAAIRGSGKGRIEASDLAIDERPAAVARSEPLGSDLFSEILEAGGYPEGMKSFRDRHGEIAMREVLGKAIRLTGSVVRAGELLGFVRPESRDKDFENLRAWMKTLGLRKNEVLGGPPA